MGVKMASIERGFMLMLVMLVELGSTFPSSPSTDTSSERGIPMDQDAGKQDVDPYDYHYSFNFNYFWILVPIIFLISYFIRRFCCRRKENTEIVVSTVGPQYTGGQYSSGAQYSSPGQYGLADQPQWNGQSTASQPQTTVNNSSYFSYSSNPATAPPGGFIQP